MPIWLTRNANTALALNNTGKDFKTLTKHNKPQETQKLYLFTPFFSNRAVQMSCPLFGEKEASHKDREKGKSGKSLPQSYSNTWARPLKKWASPTWMNCGQPLQNDHNWTEYVSEGNLGRGNMERLGGPWVLWNIGGLGWTMGGADGP